MRDTVIILDPSVPPESGECLFFTLSRELRDLIYEFVLTLPGDGALTYRTSPTSGASYFEGHTPGTEYNRLRYVCRQLNSETSGLCLRFNDLYFPHTLINGLNHYTDFLRDCPEHHLNRIKKLIIEGKAGFKDWKHILEDWERVCTAISFPNLHDFCSKHPTSVVIVRYDYLGNGTKSQSQWVIYSAVFCLSLRGSHDFNLTPGEETLVRETRLRYSRRAASLPSPPNLRLSLSKCHPKERREVVPGGPDERRRRHHTLAKLFQDGI